MVETISWCDWRLVISLTVAALVAFYFYFLSSMDYWKMRGFPQKSETLFSVLRDVFKLITGKVSGNELTEKMYKDAGDQPFLGFYQGTRPCLLIKDPDIIKHILIKDFHNFMDRGFEMDEETDPLNAKGLFSLKGQRWKNMRARLSPTFTSGRMKAMFPLMHACSDEFLKCMEADIERNSGEATTEIRDYFACYTTDVIATCAFGIQCDALQNPETSEFRRMGKLTFQFTWKRALLMAMFFIAPRLTKKLGWKFTMDETNVFFRNFVQEMVKTREEAIDKGEESGYGDFIHHLVLLKKKGIKAFDLKDDDDEEENEFLKSDKELTEQSWANVDLDDLAAQVLLFFAAGFETTSSVLSFAVFELCCSEEGKEIQRKVCEEVDRVMEEDGGKITYEGLKKMHLLDRVLNETLRLHSPAGVLSRKAAETYTIPGTSLTIDKGTMVFIPTQAMQRDERFFPNPTKFDPDRFLQTDQRNQSVFLPFGDGPRVCIGQRFALMQARLGLAAFITKFEFELCFEKTPVPLEYKKKSFVLISESGIWLKTKLREK